MSNQALELTFPQPGVALVTLTRPDEMNTLSHEFLDEFEAALNQLDGQPPRALIVTGSGRAFCCGAHLKYFDADHAPQEEGFFFRDQYLNKIARLFDRLEELPFPVIAAINGYALGGGCELALSCDFRIMANDTRMGLPEVKLGALAAAGGVQKLARHVGRGKALEWILLGSHVTPEECDKHGLLYACVNPDEVFEKALELAAEIKTLSPRAIAQSKTAIYVSEEVDLRSARRYGLEAIGMLVGSRDWRIGMEAFLQKKAPDF